MKAGNVIGNFGYTGNSTGPHLHFGVAKDGAWVTVLDPIAYLEGSESIEAIDPGRGQTMKAAPAMSVPGPHTSHDG